MGSWFFRHLHKARFSAALSSVSTPKNISSISVKVWYLAMNNYKRTFSFYYLRRERDNWLLHSTNKEKHTKTGNKNEFHWSFLILFTNFNNLKAKIVSHFIDWFVCNFYAKCQSFTASSLLKPQFIYNSCVLDCLSKKTSNFNVSTLVSLLFGISWTIWVIDWLFFHITEKWNNH